MSKFDVMAIVLRQQQTLVDECPGCDICGKARFNVVMYHMTANHNNIASTAIYELCKGPRTCAYHCTCHLDIPQNNGVTQILHVT